jgi:glycine betaine/choline ABC-type transport system substrate-binding protein
MLEDDKGFFPDYSAAYVIDMKTLDKYLAILPPANTRKAEW